MTSDKLDRRLHAFRPDLADIRLKGRVEATRFVEGVQYRIAAPVVNVRTAPRSDSSVDTQFIRGTDALVFERREGFAWAQSLTDGYVGYIDSAALEADDTALTHRVAVPRTFLYPGPDLKLAPAVAISLGSQVVVVAEKETRGTRYAILKSGEAMIFSHIKPLDQTERDYVTVAEQFIRTPYLWGGVSGFGMDCSGLIQLSMAAAGRKVLRDSDMQANTTGALIKDKNTLQRGDLVFWKGHAAILVDGKNIIHANGASMDVRTEPLETVRKRIGSPPICCRRPS